MARLFVYALLAVLALVALLAVLLVVALARVSADAERWSEAQFSERGST